MVKGSTILLGVATVGVGLYLFRDKIFGTVTGTPPTQAWTLYVYKNPSGGFSTPVKSPEGVISTSSSAAEKNMAASAIRLIRTGNRTPYKFTSQEMKTRRMTFDGKYRYDIQGNRA